MMNHSRLFLAMVIMMLMLAMQAGATTWHYTFPANLSLSLTPAPAQDGKTLRLTASLEGLVGSLSQIEVFFESSVDLKVAPVSAQLKALAQGEKKTFSLVIQATGKAADAGGSWVRLRVVYLPAYREIAQILADAAVYPDPSERRRILQRVTENQKKKARQTDATRFFPENFPLKSR